MLGVISLIFAAFAAITSASVTVPAGNDGWFVPCSGQQCSPTCHAMDPDYVRMAANLFCATLSANSGCVTASLPGGIQTACNPDGYTIDFPSIFPATSDASGRAVFAIQAEGGGAAVWDAACQSPRYGPTPSADENVPPTYVDPSLCNTAFARIVIEGTQNTGAGAIARPFYGGWTSNGCVKFGVVQPSGGCGQVNA